LNNKIISPFLEQLIQPDFYQVVSFNPHAWKYVRISMDYTWKRLKNNNIEVVIPNRCDNWVLIRRNSLLDVYSI